MTNQPTWQNKITGYDTVKACDLLANPLNARRHPAKQREALRGSLDTLGIVAPILVNANSGFVIDGHARIEEMLSRDENGLLPVLYVDLTEAQEAQFLATFDYITYLAEYDNENLTQLLESFNSDDARIQALVADMAEEHDLLMGDPLPTIDPEPQIDRAKELQAQWQTARGQVWVIDGKHRVICGDSTSEADVSVLMGGKKADCVVTDPPYGINRDKGFGGAGGFGGFGEPIPRRTYDNEWDDTRPPKECFDLMLTHAKESIIFGGNFFADILPVSTHWLVWDKLQTMPTFGDCELAWTSLKRTSVKKYTYQYNGLIGKEKERFHPTQKPVGLFVQILNDYAIENGTVLDLFLGSGTTLISCHQTGRICYGMEISPDYVAVILQRATDAGMTCELESKANDNTT